MPYHIIQLNCMKAIKWVTALHPYRQKRLQHLGVKDDLDLTNRSNTTIEKGKWWQVIRANCVDRTLTNVKFLYFSFEVFASFSLKFKQLLQL